LKPPSSNNRYDPPNICLIDYSSSGKSQLFISDL
jgi:hypothetical protein